MRSGNKNRLPEGCLRVFPGLDTDFKRQAAPKRSVTLKDAAGNLTGIDASKYPDLVNQVWRLLRKPIGDNP
jgi:hypothetical protein